MPAQKQVNTQIFGQGQVRAKAQGRGGAFANCYLRHLSPAEMAFMSVASMRRQNAESSSTQSKSIKSQNGRRSIDVAIPSSVPLREHNQELLNQLKPC